MRLSTQVALLSSLVAVLATAIMAVCAVFFFDASLYALLLVVPIGGLSFFLSLIISVFATQPFRDLLTQIKKYRSGDSTVDFTLSSSVKEVSELSKNYQDISKLAEARSNELVLVKKHQDEFVSNVAHEFRTPLTAISGNAELMLDPDMPPATRNRFCEIILTECERLKNLTNNLLALQHIKRDNQAQVLSRVNMKDIAESVVEFLAPIAQEKEVNLHVEGEAPDILGNTDRLKQALINLIDNAIRHVEKGGEVKVVLSGVREQTIVAVMDNGCGFGDVDPSLLFRRFYRTDASRARNTGGSGLGLAIVKEIVEAHDGSITAYNAPSGGAVFLMAFPSMT